MRQRTDTDHFSSAAVAQLISPEVGGPRTSVLVLAILSTVISASCFLVGSKPPSPPSTYAAFLFFCCRM
jgi:hypothetical protein